MSRTPKTSNEPQTPTWADIALEKKVAELKLLAAALERPDYFPKDLQKLCDWTDPRKQLLKFTRPILYKAQNESLRLTAQEYMKACQLRWNPPAEKDLSAQQELNSLLKVLTSRYHEERQLRSDRDLEISSLRASVDSLAAKLRELTGKPGVRLVRPVSSNDEKSC